MGIIESIAVIILSAIAAGFGGYFGSYLKKKGENLATHEDLDKLLDQVKAVTIATKQIEDKISSDTWDRQKRWELTQGVLFEASRRLAQADDALLYLNTASIYPKRATDPNWLEVYTKKQEEWSRASSGLEESRFFVAVVCDDETVNAIEKYAMLANKIVVDLGEKRLKSYYDHRAELMRNLNDARKAIRAELGIEKTLIRRSSESSATPAPDSQAPAKDKP